jgi:hypothetical protein
MNDAALSTLRSSPLAGDHARLSLRCPPRNKGLRYPADPPPVEVVVAVMRAAGETRMDCALERGPAISARSPATPLTATSGSSRRRGLKRGGLPTEDYLVRDLPA